MRSAGGCSWVLLTIDRLTGYRVPPGLRPVNGLLRRGVGF